MKKDKDIELQSHSIESDGDIDLHVHSIESDGEYKPKKLVKMAIARGIVTMAITDHNTIKGIKKLVLSEDDAKKIKIISGIELTANVDKGTMHILGYDFDLNNKLLNDKLMKFKDNNINYIIAILFQMKKQFGIEFSFKEIRNLINADRNLGRPDIAKLCVDHGYASDVSDAFEKYLVAVYDAIRDGERFFDYKECFDMIEQSGGISVLAHPKTLKLNDDELDKKIKELVDSGLKGIEVYHSSHTEKEMAYYLLLAKKYNLLISGGSDYHGPNRKKDVELGTGRNNLCIKQLSLVDEINKRRK